MTDTLLGPTLSPAGQLILRAIALPADQAVLAYDQWRASTALDAVPYAQHRAFPLLAQAAHRHAIVDPDLERMRGVGRNFWARNTLKFHQLHQLLSLLETKGFHPVTLGVPALIARNTISADILPIDALHIALPAAEISPAATILSANHYAPTASYIGRAFTPRGSDAHIVLLNTMLPSVGTLSFPNQTERVSMRELSVTVPSPTVLLFLALAQRSLADETTFLSAALQGHILLENTTIDWSALLALATRTHLEAFIFAALTTVATTTAQPVPEDVLLTLRSRLTPLKIREWKAYKTPHQTLSAKLFRRYADLRLSRLTALTALTRRRRTTG